MTSASQPARYRFEYPDEAGYPDGTGTLTEDQETLIDQILDTEERPDFDFNLVNDEENGIYEAFVGDTEIGGITYRLTGDRIVLLAASVYPAFRHQGLVCGTEQLALVCCDADSDGAIECRLLCEPGVPQQLAGDAVQLELAHPRPVLSLAAHAPEWLALVW